MSEQNFIPFQCVYGCGKIIPMKMDDEDEPEDERIREGESCEVLLVRKEE